MPRSFTELNVFLSSPGNLAAERKVVAGVIQELNEEFIDSSLRIRVVGWEMDVVPGIGPEAQSVIETQIDYDIYLGMLGFYFGHATAKAGSGTEQEFEAAYDRYVKHPETMRVLFYFKNQAENAYSIDFDQFQKVKAFKARISQAGCLYSEFDSQETLLRLVKQHFRLLLTKQWEGTNWKVLSPRFHTQDLFMSTTAGEPRTDLEPVVRGEPLLEGDDSDGEDDQMDGPLDLMVSITESAQMMDSCLGRLAVCSGEFGKKLEAGSLLLDKATESKNPRLIRDTIDTQADSMSAYTRCLRGETPLYFASAESTLGYLSRYVVLASKFGGENIENARSAIRGFESLIQMTKAVRPSLQRFRDSVSNFPLLTGKTARAKKALVRELDQFSSGTTLFLDKADQLVASAMASLDNTEA